MIDLEDQKALDVFLDGFLDEVEGEGEGDVYSDGDCIDGHYLYENCQEGEEEEEEEGTKAHLSPLEWGLSTHQSLSSFHSLPGMSKLLKRLSSELSFLRKHPNTDISQCSNIGYYNAILQALHTFPSPEGVCQRFTYTCPSDTSDTSDTSKKIEVDWVGMGGSLWVKTRAGGQHRTLEKLIGCLKEAALQNRVHFRAPRILVLFTNSIPPLLHSSLHSMGVEVYHPSLPLGDLLNTLYGYGLPYTPLGTIINMDVSSLLAMVSDLSHNPSSVIETSLSIGIRSHMLYPQIESQLGEPVLERVWGFIGDRRMGVTRDAEVRFREILELVGGPREQKRGRELVDNCVRIEGRVSERVEGMYCREREREGEGKGDEREGLNRRIFGIADRLQITTITSNASFVRSCTDKGVHLSVLLHPARALTENKLSLY